MVNLSKTLLKLFYSNEQGELFLKKRDGVTYL